MVAGFWRISVAPDCGGSREYTEDDLQAAEALDEAPAAADEPELAEESQWQRLELRCAVSWQRLDDPARGDGCAHLSRCNYDALRLHVSRCKPPPVYPLTTPHPWAAAPRAHAHQHACTRACMC